MDPIEHAAETGPPMTNEDRTQFLEAFIAGARAALSEMAGIEVAICAPTPTDLPPRLSEIAALVQLSSKGATHFSLSSSRGTAMALAQRVLAEVQKDLEEELMCDCMAEIANVIAGQAKTLLAGTRCRCTFSLPRIVLDNTQALGLNANADGGIVIFNTELGPLALQLY